MPYMGSKRKFAPYILSFILSRHPKIDTLYDVFGGGGAISLTALTYPQLKKVYYNELNSSIYELLKYLCNLPTNKDLYKLGNKLPDIFYKWITREDFKELIKGDDLKSGIAQCIWSFGNNQKLFLFGKDIEKIKKIGHDIVVFKSVEAVDLFEKEFKIRFPKRVLDLPDICSRRLALAKLYRVNRLQELQQLEQLQQLQQLERLQQLQRLQQLEITNLSYEKINVQDNENTVMYCDPPYENTASYKVDSFDSSKFYDWFSKLECSAYLSSYEAPFECVGRIPTISRLHVSKNARIEKIFYNGK